MSNITEWLANLSYMTVIIVIVVLVVLRFALLRLGLPFAKSVAEIAESLAIAMGLVFLLIRPFFVQAFFIPSESMVPTLEVRDHILVNKSVYLLRDPKPGEVIVFKAPPEALRASSGMFSEGEQTDYIKRLIAKPGDEVYAEAGYLEINQIKYSHSDLRKMFIAESEQANLADVDVKNISVKIKKDGVYVDGKKISEKKIAENYMASQNIVSLSSVNIVRHPGYVVVNGKILDDEYTAEDPDSSYPFDKDDMNVAFNVQQAVDAGKLKVIEKDGHQQVKLAKDYYLMMGDNRNHSSDSRIWGPLHRDNVVGRAMFIFWPFGRVQWVR